MNPINLIKRWYYGKDVRDNPEEPETIGGMGVFHSSHKEFHWSATIARSIVSFCVEHWQWLITTAITAVAAYATVLTVVCK